jgi:hypothetical protein
MDCSAAIPRLVPGIFRQLQRDLDSPDAAIITELFDRDAKATLELHRLEGGEVIGAELVKCNCHFNISSYDFMLTADGRVIVTGACAWGNSLRPFSMVVRLTFAAGGCEVSITNLIIAHTKL